MLGRFCKTQGYTEADAKKSRKTETWVSGEPPFVGKGLNHTTFNNSFVPALAELLDTT